MDEHKLTLEELLDCLKNSAEQLGFEGEVENNFLRDLHRVLYVSKFRVDAYKESPEEATGEIKLVWQLIKLMEVVKCTRAVLAMNHKILRSNADRLSHLIFSGVNVEGDTEERDIHHYLDTCGRLFNLQTEVLKTLELYPSQPAGEPEQKEGHKKKDNVIQLFAPLNSEKPQ